MRLTWLHLSDWHQKDEMLDRDVVRGGLLRLIAKREEMNPSLAQVHFVAFTGDLVFSGKRDQFKKIDETLLRPIADMLGGYSVRKGRFFFVPGNHDLNRNLLPQLIDGAEDRMFVATDRIKSAETFRSCINDQDSRPRITAPFKEFAAFVKAWSTNQTNKRFDPELFSVHHLRHGDKKIAVVCLNSALLSGRRPADRPNECWDYGMLQTSEWQLRKACEEIEDDVTLAICMIHHPLT